jgi:GH24 family phage-related lysozyme (muramidase)
MYLLLAYIGADARAEQCAQGDEQCTDLPVQLAPDVTPEQMDALLDTDQPPVVEASVLPVVTIKRPSVWKRDDGKPDYFRIVMLETKRREALGKPGRELKWYWDGDHKAIGYGNRIEYVSDDWKRTIKRQGYKLTETQARQLMYETYDNIDRWVRAELPNLTENQRWAVKSLAFNWGTGNLKRSKLWKYLRQGNVTPAVVKTWMRCHAGTDNHRRSRRMEVALWMGDDKYAIEVGKNAFTSLRDRGDFKHYD